MEYEIKSLGFLYKKSQRIKVVYAIWKSKQSVKLTAKAFEGSNPSTTTIKL
jgi:hypothetical protein